MIGNPPWIKIEWNEQGVLSDKHPLFAVKKMTATQTAHHREEALEILSTRKLYFEEFESLSGQQNFLNAFENYPLLKGQQTNLFKCFLPQAWLFNSESGVSAFIHPEGVFDDPKGGALREKMYPRLRKHFMFANERKLFPEVDHHTTFSLNVYGGPLQTVSFDTICNLYDAKSIVECYEGDSSLPIPGIKDVEGNWNIKGHPSRLLHITKRELSVFGKLFDGIDSWKGARLPVLHSNQLVEVLRKLSIQHRFIGDLKTEITNSRMWEETGSQKDGTIIRSVHFPDNNEELIYSGPHIFVANPTFKSSRKICVLNSDYDPVDLTHIGQDYYPRCNYSPLCDHDVYIKRAPNTVWNTKYHEEYRLVTRRMLNQGGERTLISAIIPPSTGHIHTIFGLAFKDVNTLIDTAACFASLPFDFFVKSTGKSDILFDLASKMPLLPDTVYLQAIRSRILLLNCVTHSYSSLWEKCWTEKYNKEEWTKTDTRLNNQVFTSLRSCWSKDFVLRNDFNRRQALIEIDSLIAMALGMTLEELKTIYRIQFPVLQSYEADTWYDLSGRIVFTNNRSLVGVGFSRPEWENPGGVQPVQRGTESWDGIMKHAPAGYVFTRTIIDDTMPGGPVERTIEYVAPFDRCDREKDYEIAWKFFEKKYGNK